MLNFRPFWIEAGKNALVVEGDAFKETDVIYRAMSSRGHHNDMLLKGMGCSPSIGVDGGGDGVLLLPLTLGKGGSGGDVRAGLFLSN